MDYIYYHQYDKMTKTCNLNEKQNLKKNKMIIMMTGITEFSQYFFMNLH